MDKLKLYAHIEYCLRACARATDHKEVWLHQAFGAAQYHIIIRPEDEEEVVRHWNERDKPTLSVLSMENPLLYKEIKQMPIFYFNVGENCCANESWVAEYLVNEGVCSCFDEAVDELRNHRCFNGWFECTVCNTITGCMYECGVDT